VTDELYGAQPRCPVDGVVMRDIPGGWKCPACGYVYAPAIMQQQEQPPDFDGPSIHGG
jgi:ribosomal protein L37AE/L43A